MTKGPITAQHDSLTREAADQDSTDRSAHVYLAGPTSQARNRNLLAVPSAYDTLECDVDWPLSDNIREVEIEATFAAATSDMYVIVMVNPTSPTAAAAGLDPTIDSATTDVQFRKIRLTGPKTIKFNKPITKLAFLGVNCTPDITIGGN